MKAPVLSSLLSLLLVTSTAFAGWSSSGPLGGGVTAVVAAPSDRAVIWAANTAGVYRSTDGGATWSTVGPTVVDVVRLVVHPTDPERAWALSATQGLYRTVDGGATWTTHHEFAGITAPALLIDSRNPGTLYVGGACFAGFDYILLPHSGLFRSTDSGESWSRVSPFGGNGVTQCVHELAIDPFSPWRLFESGPYSDIAGGLESYDSGQRWERPRSPRPSLGVTFDPRFPFTHYGITQIFGSAFLVSQDGGFTWSTVENKPPAGPAALRSLSIDPERGRLFLGTSKGVLRSGDGGRVWANTLVPESDVKALDFGGAKPALFAATNQGLYEVVNRGLGEVRPVDLHDIATNVLAMDVDPGDGKVVYAAVSDAPSGGATLVHGRVDRSTNGGASWEQLPNDLDVAMDQLAVDAAGTVYASSVRARAVYRRRKDETKWTLIRDHIYIYALVADPKTAGTLFIQNDSGVERSRDSGDSWEHTSVAGNYVALDPSEPRWVYAAGENHFYRSSDGGATWTDLKPAGFDNGTRGLVVAPSKGTVLYRIGANGGQPRPERSDDRGLTWHAAPLPGGAYPSSLAVDPRNESSVWAAESVYGQGLFHSTDGGATWTEVRSAFDTPIAVPALRFDPAGRVLHVATIGHGVWERTD